MPPQTFTFADPDEACKYEAGDLVMFAAKLSRWRRFWAWVRRGFRKAPPPAVMTVVGVDHATGTLTIEDRSN